MLKKFHTVIMIIILAAFYILLFIPLINGQSRTCNAQISVCHIFTGIGPTYEQAIADACGDENVQPQLTQTCQVQCQSVFLDCDYSLGYGPPLCNVVANSEILVAFTATGQPQITVQVNVCLPCTCSDPVWTRTSSV